MMNGTVSQGWPFCFPSCAVDQDASSDQLSKVVDALRAIAEHTAPEAYHTVTDWGLFIATGFLAAATLGLFFATYLVAKKTSKLVEETVNSSVIADIHHQELQAPLIVWSDDRSIIFTKTNIIINGVVANVGPGAANMVTFAIQGEESGITLPFWVFLGSGKEFFETKTYHDGNVEKHKKFIREFSLGPGTVRDQFLNGQRVSVLIAYHTIYGRSRSTKYLLNGRHEDGVGVHLSFHQEIIDLNRDERLTNLQGVREVKGLKSRFLELATSFSSPVKRVISSLISATKKSLREKPPVNLMEASTWLLASIDLEIQRLSILAGMRVNKNPAQTASEFNTKGLMSAELSSRLINLLALRDTAPFSIEDVKTITTEAPLLLSLLEDMSRSQQWYVPALQQRIRARGDLRTMGGVLNPPQIKIGEITVNMVESAIPAKFNPNEITLFMYTPELSLLTELDEQNIAFGFIEQWMLLKGTPHALELVPTLFDERIMLRS